MSMRPQGGFVFTFGSEEQANQALQIIDREIEKTMEVWHDAMKQNGNVIFVNTDTDLGDAFNEETEQMAYRDGAETLLDICKMLLKKDPECSFTLEAKVVDLEGGYIAEEKANKDTGIFSYERNVEIDGPDYDDLDEFYADEDIDLDEDDPDGESTLKYVLKVNGTFNNGKWSFKKKEKTTLELDE